MMNNLILVGKIISPPEKIVPRDSSKNAVMVRFMISVTRPFKNANGEYVNDYINVKTWTTLVADLLPTLVENRIVTIKGRIQSFQYKENDTHYIEIIADQIVSLCKYE